MNLEQRVREGLRHPPYPPNLLAPTDLADTVLRLDRRRRGRTTFTVVAAVVVAISVGVPLAVANLRGGPATPGTDGGAMAGGGPQAVHTYSTRDRESTTFVLDPSTGRYRELPFTVVLSPDLKLAAVTTGDRTGVAERAALLRAGEAAVDWIDVPPGNGLVWSPDGTALLFTGLDKGDNEIQYTAYRYDVANGTVVRTAIDTDIVGSAVGWAADSRRYLALLPGQQGTNSVEPGDLQYIEPDGRLTERIRIPGGLVGGAESYSPSRTLLFVDSSQLMSAKPVRSKVVTTEGRVVAELPAGARPIGWYDEQTVVCRVYSEPNGMALALVDAASGVMRETVTVPLPTNLAEVRLGSSAGLTTAAAELTF